MSVRILDLILTNKGTDDVYLVDKNKTPLYNPSNLGGGYTRDDAGNLVLNNEAISFDILFKTDAGSTGYTKYMELLESFSNHSMVYLRYAIPNENGYTYAYRPGYVSSITKTEGKYQNGSLVENVTITSTDSWFLLYTFTPGRIVPLHPRYATNINGSEKYKVYSNVKKDQFKYPYYYGKAVKKEIEESDWYNKRGGVLDENDNNFQLLAIHAPGFSISEDEEYALNAIKGNSFASRNISDIDAERGRGIKFNGDKFSDRARSYNFKASIENYSDVIDVEGPFKGEYTSFLVTGRSYGDCRVSQTTPSGVIVSQLGFEPSGQFIIDTAPWANYYSIKPENTGNVRGTSLGVDFSLFTKTTASTLDNLKIENGTFTKIIMRRGILGV